jgi:activator of 2-hydroxyglutaryl-CoA dehydratase
VKGPGTKNAGAAAALEKVLGVKILIHEYAQLSGALVAAVLAAKESR